MRLQLPPPVTERARTPFPWMGALAPVAAAAVLFAITRSPLSLAFAALGPLMAVASMVDGARHSRRARRAEIERRADALATLSVDIAERHHRLRRRLEDAAPSARELIAVGVRRSPARPGSAALVRLGRGAVPSGLELEPIDPRDRPIAAAAAEVVDAPVVVDALGGIGVIGAPLLTAAFARGVALQLDTAGAHADGTDRLPPPRAVLRAESLAALPQNTAVVVELRGLRDAVLRRAPEQDGIEFVPEMLSSAELSTAPVSAGVEELPARVELAGLLADGRADRDDRAGLPVSFAVAADGPLAIDLVADGPHALVGGTTGSGKSELLLAWLLALAAANSPTRLELLLFDFKGGASFDRIVALPHVRGLVTDLDGGTVDRAAASLTAELRRREQTLRAQGARSIEECRGLGRLVVVVDEFAALLGSRSELHDVFADIAARGRSLGMHLILATQRPTGVMRDSLLANCGLRISLRVVSSADSAAVVGTPGAARIPRGLPGRCLIALHGESPFAAQVATMGDDEMSALVGRLAATERRPLAGAGFLPPLPRVLPLAELLIAPREPGEIVLGRVDLPHEGSQPVALWRPGRDGALLISGAPGSGRTEAARTVAAQLGAAVLDGADPFAGELLWDGILSGGPLVVDDLESLLDGLRDEHIAELQGQLAALIRSSGRRVAITVGSPAPPSARPILAAFASRLALRSANRDEHLLSGADAALHDARLPAGGGVWQGARVQVASGARPRAVDVPQRERLEPAALNRVLVVSARPARRIAQLTASGVSASSLPETSTPASTAVLVGDPEAWQSSVMLWPRLAAETVVYDGCSPAEFRLLSRRRTLPPVLADVDGRVWITRPGDPTERGEIAWSRGDG